MLVLGYGLSGSCQRPWGSSSCDRLDRGKMKLEEVRKLTLPFFCNKSLGCLWCKAKTTGRFLLLIQLNKQNTLPVLLFHISSLIVNAFFWKKKVAWYFIIFFLNAFFFFFPLAPSRRGDLEILSFCMLHWLSGRLPWDQDLKVPSTVQAAKQKYDRIFFFKVTFNCNYFGPPLTMISYIEVAHWLNKYML